MAKKNAKKKSSGPCNVGSSTADTAAGENPARTTLPAKRKRAIKLNTKQKLFSELYCSDREFLGNGVQAYIEAYDVDMKKPNAYKIAGSCAHKLLKKAEVLAYMNKLLENLFLNEAHVDKQLAFLITQNAELGVKLGAIREYNTLKQRVAQAMINPSGQVTKIIVEYAPEYVAPVRKKIDSTVIEGD